HADHRLRQGDRTGEARELQHKGARGSLARSRPTVCATCAIWTGRRAEVDAVSARNRSRTYASVSARGARGAEVDRPTRNVEAKGADVGAWVARGVQQGIGKVKVISAGPCEREREVPGRARKLHSRETDVDRVARIVRVPA